MAVIPTIVVKIENYLSELEGVMATIEEAMGGQESEEWKESDEWKAAVTAVENGRQFSA